MRTPYKMKMKSYGKGKNPIPQLGVMNAMGGVFGGGGGGNNRNQNPQNQIQNPGEVQNVGGGGFMGRVMNKVRNKNI